MVRCSVAVLLVALVVAAESSNRSSFRGKCPISLGKVPFDPSKMTGQWYVLAGTPLFGSSFSRCPRFSLAATRSGGELLYRSRYDALSPRDGSPYAVEGIGQAYRPERGSLFLAVYRAPGAPRWSEVYAQSIVATDYQQWAVFLGCRPVFNESSQQFDRVLAAQVWGRRPDLAPASLDALKNLLTSYDVREEDIVNADHSNCNYGGSGSGGGYSDAPENPLPLPAAEIPLPYLQ